MGFMARLGDPSSWGHRRVLTGELRSRMSSRAMERLPSGRTAYAPLPEPTQRGGRRLPRRWPR